MAGRIVKNDLSRQIWLERGALWWFAVPLIVGLGAIIGLGWLGGKPGLLSMIFVAAAIIFGFRAWWLYGADGPERSSAACRDGSDFCFRSRSMRGIYSVSSEFVSEPGDCARVAGIR